MKHAPAKRKEQNKLRFNVAVLRLGHRLVRDERMSTHIGLVSRAFGARQLVLTGADDHTIDSIKKVSRRWGGDFDVKYLKNWREFVLAFGGIVVHLTMYGEKFNSGMAKIRAEVDHKACRNILVVVGAEKVPREMYEFADYNVSVGNQPHSEVAALAVFLDRLFMGEELYDHFVRAKMRIEPSSKGKKVENLVEN